MSSLNLTPTYGRSWSIQSNGPSDWAGPTIYPFQKRAQMTAAQMLRNWEAVNPQTVATEAINQTAEQAAELNRAQLFEKGQRADGSQLSPYKSDKYARRKYSMNPAPGFGVPDLKLTGELYERLKVVAKGSEVVFESDSEHATFMMKRDGAAIFGLTQDSKQQYRGVLMPIARDIIRGLTGCR